MATIPQALATAVHLHRTSDLNGAEEVCRQILLADPRQANTLNLLGLIAYQRGQPDIAINYMTRAIEANPSLAQIHANLGLVYEAVGKLQEAVACCQRALSLEPDYADAHNHLGIAL